MSFQATLSSPGLLGLSLQCCHLLTKWLNDLSAHSAGNSVKCSVPKAQPHRHWKPVCTSPFSDTSSLCTEDHISGILGCVQCCSNTEQAAGSSIPPGSNWSTNLGQVRRAAIDLQKLRERSRFCCCERCLQSGWNVHTPLEVLWEKQIVGYELHTQGCQTAHGQSGFFPQHRNQFTTEVTQWLLLQGTGWRFSQGATYTLAFLFPQSSRSSSWQSPVQGHCPLNGNTELLAAVIGGLSLRKMGDTDFTLWDTAAAPHNWHLPA